MNQRSVGITSDEALNFASTQVSVPQPTEFPQQHYAAVCYRIAYALLNQV